MTLHLLQIAKKLANDAGKMALDHQRKGFKTQTKDSENNLLTDADIAVEKFIVDTIHKNFPDHGIITEESPAFEGSSEFKWIIDPIDGTTNFAHGIPLFCISIAVVQNGKPIIGVVEIPALGETYWAKAGEGAYLNRNRISVSTVNELSKSLFATGFPYDRDTSRAEHAFKLHNAFYKASHGVRRVGAAAIDLCFVAAGRFEGFFEYGLKPWDIAAGKVIIEEAGGMVTNMDGSLLNPKLENILASNGVLHQTLIETIKKV